MRGFFDWLDERTGFRTLVRHVFYQNIPGDSRWRHVWGNTLVFGLIVQFITGMCLWMSYSPSSQTAWESVYYIQEVMSGGWLLRGIHHYTASVVNVLLVLHLMQVVVDGAYRAPREVNFWLGLALMLVVLALSLTGYLLPWDQRGFWATKVSTNIAGIVPVIGPALQRIAIGGPDYGHHTLTRFFALHAGLLPAAVVVLVIAHIYLFRRHGPTTADSSNMPDVHSWADQALKNAVACLAVMVAVLFLVLRPWLFGTGGELGAELGAPADPSASAAAARPEWYFLFLFQFLKFFPGGTEIWGAVVIPTFVLGLVFLMPIIGRWRLGHRFNVGLIFSLLIGAGLLTYLAIREDQHDQKFHLALLEAKREARRVKLLAQSPQGIPLTGAVTLLREDPLTQGPKLFARNCASCHRHDGHDGTGTIPTEAVRASDLKGFASRQWIAGLLDPAKVSTAAYFGATRFKDGKMARFVHKQATNSSSADREKLRLATLAVSAEAGLKSQAAADHHDAALIDQGRALISHNEVRCSECHQFHKQDDDATAPDLTGYGSRAWLLAFLSDPGHARFYGERNDRMPSFGRDQILDSHALGLIVDWLRGDWFEPEPATATIDH